MSTNTKEIRLIASMIAVPGKESELREVLRGLIGPTRKEPGCRRYEMYETEQKEGISPTRFGRTEKRWIRNMQSAHFRELLRHSQSWFRSARN